MTASRSAIPSSSKRCVNAADELSFVPGDVIVKPGKMAQWWGVDQNKPAIAHEMTPTGVKDHNL